MESLLNRSQVLTRLGNKSVSWLYAQMASGDFPRPIRIGSGTSVAWVASEIDEYIKTRIGEGRVTLTAQPRIRKAKSNAACAPEPHAA